MGVRGDDGRDVTARRGLLAGGVGVAVVLAATRLWRETPPVRIDYKDTSWARDIDWLMAHGIADPAEDGLFRPDEAVTREEMAVFLYRLAGAPEFPLDFASPYRDVTENSANLREIMWLRGQGIAFGAFDATFRPTERLTCGEACSLLAGMLRIPLAQHRGEKLELNAPFQVAGDEGRGRYARDIEWARSVGLDEALADGGEINGSATLLRGRCAHVLRAAENLFA